MSGLLLSARALPEQGRIIASKIDPHHGQQVFIYAHIQTNQVVYSLSRTLRPNAALKQLPFLGKQTKPDAVRRDHWRPLATVSFPSGSQGLEAYRQLREFRKRHEHEWSFENDVRMSRLKRGRLVRDQKANTVADLAAVLLIQEKEARRSEQSSSMREAHIQRVRADAEKRISQLRTEKHDAYAVARSDEAKDSETWLKFKAAKREKRRLERALKKPVIDKALKGKFHPLNNLRPIPKRGVGRKAMMEKAPMSMKGVKIEWADILDAEFAETWPAAVVHDALEGLKSQTSEAEPPSLAVVEQIEPVRPRKPEELSSLRKMLNRLQVGSKD